ncbi:MAG: gamma-glutamylcyclotransferase [Cyanobacteria bacterium P01_A01_bin.135]
MALANELISVFVYGTLKPGGVNYPRYCAGALSQQPAIARGHLYDLPAGYPAMTAPTDTAFAIYGYRLQFNDPAWLKMLDELEDYDPLRPRQENEYYRIQVPLVPTEPRVLGLEPLGTAWVYLMEPWRVQQMGGKLLPQGRWPA